MMEISTIFDARREIKLLRQVLFALSFIIGLYSYSAYADRVRDKIYNVVQSNHYCSRRLSATNQVGCSSELGGNLGVVWIVESDADLDHILKTGPTPPYIVVLRRGYYSRKNLLRFKENPDRVTGVVFLDGDHEDSKFRSKPFSPEDTCPNRYSGLYANDTKYKDCKQNSWQRESSVSGVLYDDIPYPIFLINEKKSIQDIESCFTGNNLVREPKRGQASYPLCSMQLDSFMLAASDTVTCLNSRSIVDELLQQSGRRCLLVDNQNIFAFYKTAAGPLHPNNIESHSKYKIPDMAEAQSIVMIVAKLSSLSMFTEVSPGADSTITSIVTMLAVAEALKKVGNNSEVVSSKRNIAFALLDSEPFDYTGSSSMIFAMKNDSFINRYIPWESKDEDRVDAVQNLNLNSLDYVINLDQMANYPDTSEIFLHFDPADGDSPKLSSATEVLKQVASDEGIKLVISDPQLPLPPTSVHEFIRNSRPGVPHTQNKLLGFVLSNYNRTFNNLFYNSIYDDSHNVFQTSKERLVDHIASVASFVAKSLYRLTFKEKNLDNISADKQLIRELLECYMIDADCNLFTKVWQAGQQLPSGPIQTYKDPATRSDDMNGLITYHLLTYFLGDRINEYNLTKCHQENAKNLTYNFQYINGQHEPIKDETSGVCVRSQVFLTQSNSPAYDVVDNEILVDTTYPAWTISLNGIRNPARLYLKPSPLHEWCVFFLGIVVTLMSFIVVYQIRVSISAIQAEIEQQPGTST